ncbi:glycosyltransferase, partial [Candidatus Bathyarchaeota archaeon]|nr:glycosyltransferase [Candidatus Bathyarchaeota archaeon]
MKNEDITIAYVADGSSVHTRRFLSYLANKGFNIHLITYTPSRIENVKIHNVATARTRIPLRIIQSIRLIRKIKPDVLHAFYITNNGVVAALSGFHPLVLSAWGDDIATDPERSGILKLLIKLSLRISTLVETGDELGRERLMELGCDPRKIFVQNMGVDTTLFSPNARSETLRKELKIDNFYSVLCARSWKPEYRVDVCIKAIPLVLQRIRNVKFIFLGGGPLEKELKDLATKLGVSENTLFIGKILEEEMPKYLASVDVYVDTVGDSRARALLFDFQSNILKARGGGGMGQTTRQAMACGTPQLLSDHLNVRLANWFRGLMYKQLDHRDLAEKIITLLNDKKLRIHIGQESRKIALDL